MIRKRKERKVYFSTPSPPLLSSSVWPDFPAARSVCLSVFVSPLSTLLFSGWGLQIIELTLKGRFLDKVPKCSSLKKVLSCSIFLDALHINILPDSKTILTFEWKRHVCLPVRPEGQRWITEKSAAKKALMMELSWERGKRLSLSLSITIRLLLQTNPAPGGRCWCCINKMVEEAPLNCLKYHTGIVNFYDHKLRELQVPSLVSVPKYYTSINHWTEIPKDFVLNKLSALFSTLTHTGPKKICIEKQNN